MKKKIVAVLLCLTLAFSVTGCGKDKKSESVENTESTEVVSSAAIDFDPLDYVELGDYMGLSVALTDDYSVSDDDVKTFIENSVITNYPYYVDTDKTVVEDGDAVNIDYEGLKDGVAFSGGTATDTVLEIGSNTFIDGHEFGGQIVETGADVTKFKVGDKVTLNLTFPESYKNTDRAGQAVVFNVTINKIVEKQDITYDNMTDEYVAYVNAKASLGYDTVDEMKADARNYMESSKESSKKSAIRSAVMDKLGEVCTVKEIPDGLLDARMEEVMAQYESYYCSDGSSLKDYVENTANQDYDEFVSNVTDEVTSDLKTQMILEAIAEKEGIEFDQDGFDSYVGNLMSNYSYSDESTLYKSYGLSADSGKEYLKKVYVCNLALQKVVDSATVEDEAGTENVTDTELNTEN